MCWIFLIKWLVTDEVYFASHPRIYIGRLNSTVKRKQLLDMFARYGEIVDILMKDNYAFVEYIKPQSAMQAIKEMNGKSIGNARIVVEEARPRQDEGSFFYLLFKVVYQSPVSTSVICQAVSRRVISTTRSTSMGK